MQNVTCGPVHLKVQDVSSSWDGRARAQKLLGCCYHIDVFFTHTRGDRCLLGMGQEVLSNL